MEEVEQVTLYALRTAGLNVDSSRTVEDLSTGELTLGIIYCLKYLKVDGSEQLPDKLSDGISERYKLASSLAAVLKNVGYRGRLGYDTFLYGSEADMRKILLFIQELFPVERQTDTLAQEQKEQLIRQVQNQINVLETPGVNAYWKSQASLLASASESERHALWKVLQKISIQRGKKKGKPPLPPKPGEKLADDRKEKQTEREKKKSKLEQLKEEIASSEQDLNVISQNIEKGSKKLESEKQKLASESSQSRATKIARDLLEDPEMNAERINAKLKDSERKRRDMEEQWKEIKEGLTAQKVELEAARNPVVEEISKEKAAVDDVKLQIESVKATFETAEMLLRSLEEEQEKIASSTEKVYKRSHYTKRILEFNRTLEQQKEEAAKVIEDIRVVQRTLNSTAGKLNRGFAEAEEFLFQTALRISQAKPCYKYFTEIHQVMSEIVSHIQEKGAVDREIDSLEGEVHFERRKNVKEKFTKVSTDIQSLKSSV